MFTDPETGETSMIVHSENLLIELKEALSKVLESFSEEDRNNIDLLTSRYAGLIIRKINGEDVGVKLDAVAAALQNYKVGVSSNASQVVKMLAFEFLTTLITKIL